MDCRLGWGQSDGTSVLGRVMKADEEGEETVVDGLLLEGVDSVEQG